MLPEFELLIPQTLQDALRMTQDIPGAAPLAGGTNLIVDLRNGRHTPTTLININGLHELCSIQVTDEMVFVGSGVTIGEILRDPSIAKYGLCLRQAGLTFANPLIANRATLGGNLADASPAADMAPPLIALGASVELISSKGKRIVPIEDFFIGVRKTALQPGELINAVRWPLPPAVSVTTYYKLGLRKADAISVVTAAIYLEGDSNGKCAQARIAMGSVAPKPLRVPTAEAVLKGEKLTDEAISKAAQLAFEASSPISDIRASGEYRREMVKVLVSRLLHEAADKLWK